MNSLQVLRYVQVYPSKRLILSMLVADVLRNDATYHFFLQPRSDEFPINVSRIKVFVGPLCSQSAPLLRTQRSIDEPAWISP